MSNTGKVAVQATKRDFYGLQHVCGDTLDDHGRGEWPRDSFTFRLRDEKAIRLIEAAEPEPETATATTEEPAPAAKPAAKATAKVSRSTAASKPRASAAPKASPMPAEPEAEPALPDEPKTADADLPAVISPAAQE